MGTRARSISIGWVVLFGLAGWHAAYGETSQSRPTSRARPAPASKTQEGAASAKIQKGQLLTKEQINRIRMAELKPDETVPVRFKGDVLAQYQEQVLATKEDRDAFRSLTNREKVTEILKSTGTSLADSIEIGGDPEALRVFRTDVMPLVRTGCATTKCHGGPEAPKIRLYAQDTPAAVYTNFYALDSFDNTEGKPMFDRQYPEDSLFMNYLLGDAANRELAHPGKIPALVRDTDDRRYQRVFSWVKDVLKLHREDPEIDRPVDVSGKKPAGAAVRRSTTRTAVPAGK